MSEILERRARDAANAFERSTHATERSLDRAGGGMLQAGMAWWDLMLRMQRASLASLSVYSPGTNTRVSTPEIARGGGAAVVPLGEERLNVGTRTVLGETTRLRRRVVETPVEQDVTLRDERVVLERRPSRGPAPAREGQVLTETVVEMSDSRQVPQVWKSVHVAEEVVLKREVTERKERVRETLRRDVLEVEHEGEARVAAGAALAVQAAMQEEARREAEAVAQAAAEAIRPRAEPQPDAARDAARDAEERRKREAKDAAAPAALPVPGPRKG
jgi:uncharacterized protein (TIGR02271 family)